MAPPRKRPDQRQDNRPARAALAVVKPTTPTTRKPAASRGWRKATKDAWAEYWCSEVSGAAESVDLSALRRLFTMRDMQAACWARYEAEPYVDGSKGQPVANPALDDALKLERAIVALEDRLALSPKARANLSIAIGQAQMTAADLNRMAKEGSVDEDQDIVDAELVEEWADAEAN